MKQVENKRHLYVWFLSYFIIVIVSVLFGVLVYELALNVVRKNADEAQEQALLQTKISIEQVYNSASTLSYSLANQDIVTRLKSKTSYEGQDMIRVAELQETLGVDLVINSAFSDLLVYFNATDYFLTPERWFRPDYGDLLMERALGLSQNEWNELKNRKESNSFWIDSESQRVWYIYKSYSQIDMNVCQNLIMVSLNTSYIRQLLQNSDGQTYLLDSYGNSLSGDGEALQWEKEGINQKITALRSDRDKENYLVYESDGQYVKILAPEETSLSLVSIVPKSVYLEQVNHLQNILWIYIILCVLIGGLVAWLLAKKNYSPIERIMSQIKRGEGKDEFREIESFIDNMKKENGQINRMLKSREEMVQRSVFYNILKGSDRNVENMSEVIPAPLQEILSHKYMLMGFEVDELGREFQDVEEGEALGYFMLQNVIYEICREYGNTYVNEIDGVVYAVLQVSFDQLEEKVIASRICQFFMQHMHMTITCNMSSKQDEAGKISDLYNEIQELITFREVVGTKNSVLQIVDIERTKDNPEIEWYYVRKQLDTLLEQRDIEKSIKVLQKMKRNEEENIPAAEDAKGNLLLMKKVEDYVRQHYMDPTLSVGMLADTVQMGISNLSQSYKRYMGRGVLDFINELRVERAKQLLEEGKTVKDAAELSGYYGPRPLVRAFKQYTGMLPSEYRDAVRGADIL